jgi:hydroxymethylglutaryl-CoA lyase
MADSETVLQNLNPPPDVEIIGIVVNEKGAQRAIATGAVRTLGFPYSISPEFLHRNQKQTPPESLYVLGSIAQLAEESGINVVAYVSMAFGNPYGEAWSVSEVTNACRQLIGLGICQISLADTVGLATPAQITETVERALAGSEGAEVGVHLHARPQDAAAKVRAAYHAGCRRFDAAIGGLGGCPFAQDALVGNLPTEALIAELAKLGARLPTLSPLDGVMNASAEIARSFGAKTKERTAKDEAGERPGGWIEL